MLKKEHPLKSFHEQIRACCRDWGKSTRLAISLFLALFCAVATPVDAATSGSAAGQHDLIEFESPEAEAELERLWDLISQWAATSWRMASARTDDNIQRWSQSLNDSGLFPDIEPRQRHEAFHRLWVLSSAHLRRHSQAASEDLRRRIYQSLVAYSKQEVASPTRWPMGAFQVPRSYLGAWFNLHDLMKKDRKAGRYIALLDELDRYGDQIAFQAWHSPDASQDQFRKHDPLNINVFRDQPHFIVANFMGYRPVLMYAVYKRDIRYVDLIMRTAYRSLHEPVVLADLSLGFWPEGITVDRNVTAHGPQAYPFGYGRDYLNGMLGLASTMAGGPYAFTVNDYNVIADAIINGLRWFEYKGQAEYSVLGRHNLTPRAGTGTNGLIANLITRLLKLAPADLPRRSELKTVLSQMKQQASFSGSKYFWNTEDYVHRTNDYAVMVNIKSQRSAGPENVRNNAEQNFHFGNGSMMLYLDGDEYMDARGAWHFRALPGVTAEYDESPPPYITAWHGIPGEERFAGGVSRDGSGICAFYAHQEQEAARARKAWFFHDDTIVCLGTAIRHGENQSKRLPIQTTLNQTAWRTDIHVATSEQVEQYIPTQDHRVKLNLKETLGIWHDHVSYIVQSGGDHGTTAGILAQTRNTDWAALAGSNQQKDGPQQVKVFQLYLDHGKRQNAGYASYAYAVLPRTSPQQMRHALEQPTWEVVANRPQIQAVAFEDDQMIQAVFHQPGKIAAAGMTIQVNRAAIVMIQRINDGHYRITYQDPLHRTSSTNLQLQIEDHANDQDSLSFDLPFPDGLEVGRPVSMTFDHDGHRILEKQESIGKLP